MNAAGGGGVFGAGDSFDHGGDVGNSDFYAKGSAIRPVVLGTYSRAGKVKTRGKKCLKCLAKKCTCGKNI